MNTILEALEANHHQMKTWFEHLHRTPELSMQEQETARYSADTVGQWGYGVETGIGKYGIVASMAVGSSGRAIEADTKSFNGTVRLIFQPGEETMEGAASMIRDGLFDRFPVDAAFGMHNMPGLELGKLYFTPGDVMAAVDNWEIELTGKGDTARRQS